MNSFFSLNTCHIEILTNVCGVFFQARNGVVCVWGYLSASVALFESTFSLAHRSVADRQSIENCVIWRYFEIATLSKGWIGRELCLEYFQKKKWKMKNVSAESTIFFSKWLVMFQFSYMICVFNKTHVLVSKCFLNLHLNWRKKSSFVAISNSIHFQNF